MAQPIASQGLIDTDILIDATRGRASAQDFLVELRRRDPVQTSVVSAMELIVGCRDSSERRQIERFLGHTVVLPIAPTASEAAYRLVAKYYLSHGLLIADALIAATALDEGLTLYTLNTRHFRMIPDLQLVRPY